MPVGYKASELDANAEIATAGYEKLVINPFTNLWRQDEFASVRGGFRIPTGLLLTARALSSPVAFGVAGAILDGDGRVLLVRQTYMRGLAAAGRRHRARRAAGGSAAARA